MESTNIIDHLHPTGRHVTFCTHEQRVLDHLILSSLLLRTLDDSQSRISLSHYLLLNVLILNMSNHRFNRVDMIYQKQT